MASAKLMVSSISRNSDLKLKSSSSSSAKSSISDLQIHRQTSINQDSTTLGLSMTVNRILRNVYSDDNRASESTLVDAEITLIDAAGAVTTISASEGAAEIRRQESGRPKTVDDVWREIVAGRREKRECKQEAHEDCEMMTLEDFLAKADAAEKEEVKVEPSTERRLSGGIFAFDQAMIVSERSGEGLTRFGSGVEAIGGGRGKRKALLEPLDKAAQQRQRRMIKNRESAARSRERKQAYQVELESMAVKLEEENELLLKEKAEQTKARFKQLMERVVPVVEKRRPQRILRRVRSTHW